MYKVHIINKYIKNRNPTRHFGSPYPSKVNLPSEYQQFTKKRRVLWRSITGRRQNVALIAKLLNFTGGGGGAWVFESASTVGASLLKMFTVITSDILEK